MQQEIFTLEQAKVATSWAELMGEYEVEKQCAKIATWLKRYCGVSGSAFFSAGFQAGPEIPLHRRCSRRRSPKSPSATATLASSC